jgi:hypothetical protein
MLVEISSLSRGFQFAIPICNSSICKCEVGKFTCPSQDLEHLLFKFGACQKDHPCLGEAPESSVHVSTSSGLLVSTSFFVRVALLGVQRSVQ